MKNQRQKYRHCFRDLEHRRQSRPSARPVKPLIWNVDVTVAAKDKDSISISKFHSGSKGERVLKVSCARARVI